MRGFKSHSRYQCVTQVQHDRLTGFNASLKMRGVSVTLITNLVETADGEWTADSNAPVDSTLEADCLALIQPITAKDIERLQIADMQITHLVHVLRTNLVTPTGESFDRKSVTEIDRSDSAHSYRVQNFTDDAQRPSVIFHCILA